MKTTADFPRLLAMFFTKHLIQQRQASSHTIASYRDTFRLLVHYAQQELKGGGDDDDSGDASDPAGERDDQDEIALKGRSGTDFRPEFEWLDEHDMRPGVCLDLTDMRCSSHLEAEPEFATIWCNYGNTPSQWNREPWGERIDMAAA